MSYRPTISVYINNHIVDCGYYRNWTDRDLFYEAICLATLFNDCETKEQYMERMYGVQTVYFKLDPEEFENNEENLKWFEEASEFPIIVDITNRNIYSNCGVLKPNDIKSKQSIFDLYDFFDVSLLTDIDYYHILSKFRIPFDHLDFSEIRRILIEWNELSYHMSDKVYDLIVSKTEKAGNLQKL